MKRSIPVVLVALLCALVGAEAASASVCRNLHQKADVLYKKAIRMGPSKKGAKASRAGQIVPACLRKGAGLQAVTLYKAALVYKCPKRYLATFRLAVLHQACLVALRSSCRYYGMFRRDCNASSGCRRSPMTKGKMLVKLLPFLVQDAQTDSDKDGFKSCLKTRIECSALARIKEIPLPGLGKAASKGGKIRCDCDDSDNKVRPGAFEICDGKDNDCDGEIDESAELKPPPCSNQRGVCRGARKRCGGARGWLLCEAVDFARKGVKYEDKEISCDGLDNDCDGRVDNGLQSPLCRVQRGLCAGAKKACGGKKGWLACTVNDYQKHAPHYELTERRCDGMDNDCNGKVDDVQEAPSCRLEAGLCAGLKKRCGGKKGWLACTEADYRRHAARYELSERRCDGVDNDCDGAVDETCTPIYPWIIAGTGAAVILMGGLVSGLSVHNPDVVAATPQANRPAIADVRGLVTFGNTSVVIGSVAAAAGLGLGVAFLVRALRQRAAPPQAPPAAKTARALSPGPSVVRLCIDQAVACGVAPGRAGR